MNTYDRAPYAIREYIAEKQNKSAQDIQRDLDLMRAMYALRRNLNAQKHSEMVGWSLVAIAVGVPLLVAIAILI